MTSLFLDRLRQSLNPSDILTAPEDRAKYEADWRRAYQSSALAVLRPRTVEQVQAIVNACREHQVSITPQGGNTGLVGGGLASNDGSGIVLSLEKLNRIREFDSATGTCVAEAGCITANLQEAVAESGWQWPLSLAAEGTCTLGGNIATNAGGLKAIKYGVMRDSVLGLEVVLADGAVISELLTLKKDNTGLALRNLFIGSEGTLGLITAASIQTAPAPQDCATALVALKDAQAALELLQHLRAHFGQEISAFEYISIGIMRFFQKKYHTTPIDLIAPAYVLLEVDEMSVAPACQLRERLETCLGFAFEANLISDAIVAQSKAQKDKIWWMREHLPDTDNELQVHTDIALPVSKLPEAETRLQEAADTAAPSGCTACYFGHFGDGNLHYNVHLENDDEKPAVIEAILDQTVALGGSISAEHGVGRAKRDILPKYKSAHSLDLMRRVRKSFDPYGLFNPDVMLHPNSSDIFESQLSQTGIKHESKADLGVPSFREGSA